MISIFASILRFTFRSILLIVFMVFLLFPWLMVINHYRGLNTEAGSRKADLAAISLAKRLNWFFGIRVQLAGSPVEGAVLIAANHISWLDITVLHSACAMGFVAKAEIDDWPVFNFIARTGGSIFHQRGSHDSAADVNFLMVQRLQQDRAVTIFPEGGIKPGSSIRVFHARMFRAAVDVGCTVQPVMLRYLRNGQRDDEVSFRENESMLRNFVRLLARSGVIADVHFLPPISAKDQPRRALADAARAAVVNCYEKDS